MKMKLLEFDNQWIPASDVLMNLSTEYQKPDKRKLSGIICFSVTNCVQLMIKGKKISIDKNF